MHNQSSHDDCQKKNPMEMTYKLWQMSGVVELPTFWINYYFENVQLNIQWPQKAKHGLTNSDSP